MLFGVLVRDLSVSFVMLFSMPSFQVKFIHVV